MHSFIYCSSLRCLNYYFLYMLCGGLSSTSYEAINPQMYTMHNRTTNTFLIYCLFYLHNLSIPKIYTDIKSHYYMVRTNPNLHIFHKSCSVKYISLYTYRVSKRQSNIDFWPHWWIIEAELPSSLQIFTLITFLLVSINKQCLSFRVHFPVFLFSSSNG